MNVPNAHPVLAPSSLVPDAGAVLGPRPLVWLERAQALLLALGGLYFLAIGQLSPHPLPGLRWLALSVVSAGLTSAFRSTRLRRTVTALCFLTVALGVLGVGDIALKCWPALHGGH